MVSTFPIALEPETSSLQKEMTPTTAPGTVRIALFGDSFTHEDDDAYEESWGAVLENQLNRQGVHAEVINLGGPGYGVDQAYLRWVKMENN